MWRPSSRRFWMGGAAWVGGAALAMLAASLGGAVGCRFGVDVDQLTACTDHPASCADAGFERDAGPEPDPARDAGADAVAPLPGTCPTGRGSDMVLVPVPQRGSGVRFCVDRVEVTNADYQAFLDDSTQKAPALAGCGDDPSHLPRSYPPPAGSERLPVVFVDYCDAEAYCVWAGKALCGSVAGSVLDGADIHDPERDAWFVACGGPDRAFPYGETYDPAACNGVDRGLSRPRAADEAAACVAPSGALELSGNVWEWTRSCEGDTSLFQRCYARGGAFNAPASELTCSSLRFIRRDSADATMGFRCCASVSE